MDSYKSLKRFGLLTLVGVYAFLIIYFFRDLREVIVKSHWSLAILIGLAIFGIIGQAFSFILMLPISERGAISRAIGVWSLSSITNYIAPFAPGLAVRSLYFNKLGNSYSCLAEKTVAWLVGSFYISSVFAVAALVGIAGNTIFAIVSLSIGALGAPFVRNFLEKMQRYHVKNEKVVTVLRTIKLPPNKILIISMSQYLAASLGYYFALRISGVDAGVFEVVLISCGVLFLTVLPLMPNGLGITDSILGVFAMSHGAAAGAAISAVVMLRIAHLVACAILLLLLIKSESPPSLIQS